MKDVFSRIAVISCLICLANPLWLTAQDIRTEVAQEIPAADLQLAEDVLLAMSADKSAQAGIDAMLAAQLRQAPMLAQFEGTMRDFFAQYLSWESMAGPMSELYAKTYNRAELEQLLAFYQSPIGQKVAAVTPQLTVQGAAIGERLVVEHMPELQEQIAKQMQKQSEGDDDH